MERGSPSDGLITHQGKVIICAPSASMAQKLAGVNLNSNAFEIELKIC